MTSPTAATTHATTPHTNDAVAHADPLDDEIRRERAHLAASRAALARMRERAESALAGLSGALPRTVQALLPFLPGEDELARAD